jgi:hypothetical protein
MAMPSISGRSSDQVYQKDCPKSQEQSFHPHTNTFLSPHKILDETYLPSENLSKIPGAKDIVIVKDFYSF